MQPRVSFVVRVSWPLALVLIACASQRAARPTLLGLPPPLPEPASDEARLMPIELRPGAAEPIETAPGQSLAVMARRALDGAQPEVLRCYEELLVHHASAAGGIEMRFDLSSTGAVLRPQFDHQGEGGIEGMIPCLRDVLGGLRVREVSAHGQYVSRVYTFSNPPIDRVVQATLVINAPPRPVRVRARRGAAPPPTASTPPATVPRPGPGSVRAEEITRGLTDVPALRECAALAFRRARRPPGAATLHLTVAGDGSVSEASVEATPPWSQAVVTCVVEATQALHFRASGIVVRAQVPVTFHR